MYNNTINTATNSNSGDTNGESCPAIPILYIEESIKRHYDVKKKVKGENGGTRMRTSKKKYYDIDWRVYIMYRFGSYVVCGTRCPMYDYYNNKWPVVSMSFPSSYEAYNYVMLLLGRNKVNLTLYVSRIGGCATDLSFSQPTGDRFRELDDERINRRNEMVGYDRVYPNAKYTSDSTIVNILSVLASAANGSSIVPFTASKCPSSRDNEWSSTCRCVSNTEPTESSTTVPATGEEFEEERADRDYNYNLEDDHDIQYDDYYDYVAHDHESGN